ncbi:MAG: rhamnulokinase family protein [Armatimonadota bacterium]|nr:rhamnulokinase family protein [Armatimonadota bacterium]
MSSQVYLAVDLGAESGRVVAGLYDGARLELKTLHRFPNTPLRLPDALTWNVLRQYAEILQGIALAVREAGDSVRSVGVDTWGVDFGLLDARGTLLTNPVHYRDPRTNGIMENVQAMVGADTIYEYTGIQFMPINTLYQLVAVQQQHPGLLELADKMLMMPDLFHYWLSGVMVSERTIASTSQMMDARTGEWALDLLRHIGLPTHFLPEIVPPGTPLGKLRRAIVEETGAPAIEVITPGSHDTASAVAAVPAAPGSDFAYISSGTWSLMGVELSEPLINAHSRTLNFTNEGGVHGTIRFLRNIMGLWLVQECRRAYAREGQEYTYEQLTQMAAEAEPFRAVIDPDDRRFLNPPDMRQAIREYCETSAQPAPETPGQFVRCCLESLALRYRWVLEQLQNLLGRRISVIHVVGGGSQNRLLCQFTADACHRTVLTGPVEATAAGNVMLQMIALSELKGITEGRALIRRSTEMVEYTPRDTEAWDSAYERFLRLVE